MSLCDFRRGCFKISGCLIVALIVLLNLTDTIRSNNNKNQQQITFSFDDDEPTKDLNQEQYNPKSTNAQVSSSSPDSYSPAPIPTPTGLTAKVLKRVTSWNDSVIARITGEIPPRAPHPFVAQITDQNYDQVIHSNLDEVQNGWGSDDETVWVLAVVANDRVSVVFDEEFDKIASNSSLAVNPPPRKKREDEITVKQLDRDDPFLLKPHIRFGRIDYMGKTDLILTRWLIFKCPILVVITKRGQELRFFKTGGIPPKAEVLFEFLKESRWVHKPVWKSTFSPGGSCEWILIYLGKFFQVVYSLGEKVPGWLLMMISSALGTSLMQWLHSKQNKTSKNQIKKNQSKFVGGSKAAGTDRENDPKNLKAELAQAALELAEATKRKRELGQSSNTETNKISQSSIRSRAQKS